MKKLHLLFLSFICLCSLSAFADSPCDKEANKTISQQGQFQRQKTYHYYNKAQQQPCQKPVQNQCVKQKTNCTNFLCSNVDMNSLFKKMCLSDTQICNAQKIQDRYEHEVLSLSERIDCENVKYNQLKQSCAKKSELRKQKRLIRKLEKKRKEICKCYEKEFKTTLSKDQQKAYKKYKKCK